MCLLINFCMVVGSTVCLWIVHGLATTIVSIFFVRSDDFLFPWVDRLYATLLCVWAVDKDPRVETSYSWLINSCVLLISEFRYYQRNYEPLQYQVFLCHWVFVSWLLTVVSRELHSSDRIGQQGKKDQRPSSNSGPTLYRRVWASRDPSSPIALKYRSWVCRHAAAA